MPPRPRPHRKAKEKQDVKSLFAQPSDNFYRLPEIEVRGGRVMTDGCRKVLAFNKAAIELDMGKSLIKVYGIDLQIESYSQKRLVIQGKIAGMKFVQKWSEDG
jgi:sporulation protein YqfC